MIFANGDVKFCCGPFGHQNGVLGNLYNDSFENIWNSNIAQDVRKEALNNNYPFCNQNMCNIRVSGDEIARSFLSDKQIKYEPIMTSYPRFVGLAPDCECNVRCVTCRKDLIRYSDRVLEDLNKKISTFYLPILKDAELVMLNNSGEALYSRHSRELIKAIIKKYPKIKFVILTNGILCNQKILKQLKLENRISSVIVSLNSITKETYNKFTVGGNFDVVMKNLQYLKKLLLHKKINAVMVSLVITALNYKEIPQFIEYAKSNNFYMQLLPYCDWGHNMNYSSEYLSIFNKTHQEFKDFLKIYKNYIIPYQKESHNWIRPK